MQWACRGERLLAEGRGHGGHGDPNATLALADDAGL